MQDEQLRPQAVREVARQQQSGLRIRGKIDRNQDRSATWVVRPGRFVLVNHEQILLFGGHCGSSPRAELGPNFGHRFTGLLWTGKPGGKLGRQVKLQRNNWLTSNNVRCQLGNSPAQEYNRSLLKAVFSRHLPGAGDRRLTTGMARGAPAHQSPRTRKWSQVVVRTNLSVAFNEATPARPKPEYSGGLWSGEACFVGA